jgi:hypothetical protein
VPSESQSSSEKLTRFFYVPPLDLDPPFPEAPHEHVRVQVFGQVIVRGRAQEPDPAPGRELPQVERQHLRQRAVEDRGELVEHQRLRTRGERERRAEPVPLAVRKLARRPEQEPGFGQPARGKGRQPLVDRPRQRVDQRQLGQRHGRDVGRPEQPADFPHERRLAAPRWPGEQHHVSGANVQRDPLRDGVGRLILGEPEQVGNVPRREAPAGRPERVADGDGTDHRRVLQWEKVVL